MTRIPMGLTLALMTGGFGLTPARATDYYHTLIVNVDYGVETVLSRNGSLLETYDLVTADTEGSASLPTGLIEADFPGLITQIMNDSQLPFIGIPSFVLPGLAGLEDAYGFGINNNADSVPGPAVTVFDQNLAANAGGPFYITADTGFQIPLIVETEDYCNYVNSFGFGTICMPQNPPATTSDYSLTYQLGPTSYGGDTYTELVNFELLYRNVTVQAAPEPSTWAMMLVGFAGLGYLGYRRRRDFAATANG